MKSCCSIDWEDNVDVCPICHNPILNIVKIDESDLNEYSELRDTDFVDYNIPITVPIPFRILTYKVYDEEKDVEKNIKIHVVEEINKIKVEIIDEIKKIENKIDVLSKKIESKHDSSDINKTIRVEDIPNTTESNRMDLLKDFVNEGKIKIDKGDGEIPRYEVKNNMTNKKEEVKIDKDEIVIGKFIVNKKLLVASIMIIIILIIGVILQVTSKW